MFLDENSASPRKRKNHPQITQITQISISGVFATTYF